MAETQPYLDFELCRKIMARLEDVLLREMHPSVPDFQFDGYDVEMVGYNVLKLHGSYLISAQEKSVWTRTQLRHWPVGFIKRGREFLAASKDEKAWTEALATMERQGGVQTLKRLKGILLDGGRSGDAGTPL